MKHLLAVVLCIVVQWQCERRPGTECFKRSIGRLLSWSVLALMLFSGTARADLLIFNATTHPMTGDYIPVGSGDYGIAPPFSALPDYFFTGPGDEGGYFIFQKEEAVPYNPSSPLPCLNFALLSGLCYDLPEFVAPNGTPLGFGGSEAVDIVDSTGNLLAAMGPQCISVNTQCNMFFVSGVGGAPLDVTSLGGPVSTLGSLVAGPHINILATGGIQGAMDLDWYDGSRDSFEFILNPIPEPSALVLLGTIVLGLGTAFKRSSLVANPDR